jgi:hypothetical protein
MKSGPFVAPVTVVAVTVVVSFLVACGETVDKGVIVGGRSPEVAVEQRQQRVATAAGLLGQKAGGQVLFGDLHVHTSFSPDGFILGIPLTGGEGVRPPADACDYARYCSAMDFWGISDHAEGVTPGRWAETRESIRQCNEVTGEGANPDLVSFLGYEWSHVALTPDKHYGHKNVFFLDTADDRVPARAIAAPRENLAKAPIGRGAQLALAVADWENREFYLGIQAWYDEVADTPVCERGVNSRELPVDCLEVADNPRELFSKLDDWGYDALVIPHGNTWGMNTPAETRWDKQLTDDYQDPNYQKLIEIYSGHGNSEHYRDWMPVGRDAEGAAYCPEPGDNFLPCCWRAGEIIQQRCDDPHAPQCLAAVADARRNYLDAGISGHLTVPGASVADWLNCGQCEDCFNPSFKLRTGTSTQYALTLNKPENQPDRRKFRFGFIGSSDNHRARAGNGYKDFGRRRGNTEVMGAKKEGMLPNTVERGDSTLAESRRLETLGDDIGLNEARNMERQQSFFLTGGLVAVHSPSRDRGSIWDALNRRQVYATSGDRILLWFDLLNGPAGPLPMGSEVAMGQAPRFRVSAAGDFKQLPGCPDYVSKQLGAERQASLCAGECYNPGDERRAITRLEIVRIRPRQGQGESTAELIEDPWRVIPCEQHGGTCSAEFEDPEFSAGQREVIYYARAIQEPTPAVNAGGVRCEYDANGICIAVNPCYGDYRTDPEDDCQSPNEERAWSSPIFVDYRGVSNEI